MTLVCEQQVLVVLEAEALIKEARRRQHRRWFALGALVVVVAATVGVVAARNGGGRPALRPTARVSPSTTAELFGRSVAVPSQFIAAGWPVQNMPAGQLSWGRELVLMATMAGCSASWPAVCSPRAGAPGAPSTSCGTPRMASRTSPRSPRLADPSGPSPSVRCRRRARMAASSPMSHTPRTSKCVISSRTRRRRWRCPPSCPVFTG